LNKFKLLLDKLMVEIKKQNPDATWTNLVTGVVILVLIALGSVWYFGNAEISNLNNSNGDEIAMDSEENSGESMEMESYETTTVEAGEGLWKVAARVCGDGEKYNILATANGLTINSSVYVGQELMVVCE
jgi:hypothetical protein